ncbi:Calcium-dependent secretion activator [Portunus trituberculatus]|uniref:Calcium-dependent secretion activator n=1 Tax=Portunus trituberculatus TaxID=210409 RepID=A0A5B7EZA6_PORTR|nr:Calcium-dependent secretion activator [Portunus trituberculatus]
MACDMIESCITRTDQAFQQWLKKGTGFVSTDYVLPSEMCAMVNVILDAKNQSFKLCAVDGVDVYGDRIVLCPLEGLQGLSVEGGRSRAACLLSLLDHGHCVLHREERLPNPPKKHLRIGEDLGWESARTGLAEDWRGLTTTGGSAELPGRCELEIRYSNVVCLSGPRAGTEDFSFSFNPLVPDG